MEKIKKIISDNLLKFVALHSEEKKTLALGLIFGPFKGLKKK